MDHFMGYLLLQDILIKKKLIKINLLDEIQALKNEINLKFLNYGTSGILLIVCHESRKFYIKEDQNSIFKISNQIITTLCSNKSIIGDSFINSSELQQDVLKYNHDCFSFEFSIFTGFSLNDSKIREEKIKQSFSDYSYYNLYKNDQ